MLSLICRLFLSDDYYYNIIECHNFRSPPPVLRNPADWSLPFRDFIAQCVIKDFEQRPYIAALLKDPFIEQVAEDTSQV